MSVDSKEPSSEEVKTEDESSAPVDSGVKNASETKPKGKKILSKTLSPAEKCGFERNFQNITKFRAFELNF